MSLPHAFRTELGSVPAVVPYVSVDPDATARWREPLKESPLNIGLVWAGAARESPAGMDLLDPTEELNDFADTAALVAALDLVISVDTSVAHLAGALGKSVWILSRYDGCWRWLLDRDDSPWYPTARLFRQPAVGDWDSVIASVASALEQWSREAAPRRGDGGGG